MPFGNVNVAYTPCKSIGQLKSAALYMLGKKAEQVRNGTVKTSPELYTALCPLPGKIDTKKHTKVE